MNHSAKAVQHKPHGAVTKPHAIVSRPRLPGRATKQRASQQAEGILMRLVGRLQVDAAASASARSAHGYFVNGFFAALEALGIVPAPRVAHIRTACDHLLDGAVKVAGGTSTLPTARQAYKLTKLCKIGHHKHAGGRTWRMVKAKIGTQS